MGSERSRAGQLRGIYVCVVGLIAALALAVAPAQAAVSPVLEFVTPGAAFPVAFTASGGEVTAELADFDSVVHCTGSQGEGEISGPRSTLSNFAFTGCKAVGGGENGQKCESPGAGDEEELTAEGIEAELVYIDQAKHEVGMLLNPGGGVYMSFVCGGESVDASGPFLSPVDPINQKAASFTATLNSLDAMQIPGEYENAIGEKRQAIPMGKRGINPLATTGVDLSFTIHPSVPLEIKAVTAAEIEAKQREDEAATAAAAKKRRDEEAATAAAVKKRHEEEDAAAAAAGVLQEEEARLERLRHQLLSSTLAQCRKGQSRPKRMRCERRAKKKYGSHVVRND